MPCRLRQRAVDRAWMAGLELRPARMRSRSFETGSAAGSCEKNRGGTPCEDRLVEMIISLPARRMSPFFAPDFKAKLGCPVSKNQHGRARVVVGLSRVECGALTTALLCCHSAAPVPDELSCLCPAGRRSAGGLRRLDARGLEPHEDLSFSGSVRPYRSRSAFASSVRPSSSSAVERLATTFMVSGCVGPFAFVMIVRARS
jgi:hypothetical protein